MANFSDDFNRADNASLGANWSEWVDGLQIVSNQAVFDTASGMAVYIGNSTVSVSQYGLVGWSGGADVDVDVPFIMLRCSASGSPFYTVRFLTASDTVEWRSHTSSADTAGTLIGTVGQAVGNSESWGVTITETGNNTEVRCWLNPTGLPDSPSSWNGDSSPEITFTDNPGSAVDTGNNVGIGYTTGNPFAAKFDNFFGGDSVQIPLVMKMRTYRPRPFAPGYGR